jgi:ABC-type uncharacterized transport system substrate-binding protein
MASHIERRKFLATLGAAAAAWPLAASGQQPGMTPIGYLHPGSLSSQLRLLEIFRRILAETGYVEGRNLTVEYRFAEGKYDALPQLAADLMRGQVRVIVAPTTPAALAAKSATLTIPIVFSTSDDPVGLGLVASFARPGGNATGIHFFQSALAVKQLGLLHDLLPQAARIGVLINPENVNADAVTKQMAAAASSLGLTIDLVLRAKSQSDIETAFATFSHNRVDALLCNNDPFFFTRRLQMATLASRHAIPAIYPGREYAEVGGLMSYGTSLTEVHRQIGTYTARILKGDKPADLPVVQSTKLEFVINLPTARALGIDVPPTLLAIADEVIE